MVVPTQSAQGTVRSHFETGLVGRDFLVIAGTQPQHRLSKKLCLGKKDLLPSDPKGLLNVKLVVKAEGTLSS